jgi:RNAse (barnase) inhibitor barstar
MANQVIVREDIDREIQLPHGNVELDKKYEYSARLASSDKLIDNISHEFISGVYYNDTKEIFYLRTYNVFLLDINWDYETARVKIKAQIENSELNHSIHRQDMLNGTSYQSMNQILFVHDPIDFESLVDRAFEELSQHGIEFE